MSSYPAITHVIYDMDGLLLDTEKFYTQATNAIVMRFGKSFDWSVKSKMIGKRAADSARILTEALQLPISPQEYLALRAGFLDDLFPHAEPLPGALRLTEHLHRHSIPQAVATSSDARTFKLKTTRHADWFGLFDCVILGDDPAVELGKPAPDIFLLAAHRLGAPPSSCLVFEDSPAGIEAAKSAGMRAIAVPDPNMDRGAYPAGTPILESLEEFVPHDWGLPPF